MIYTNRPQNMKVGHTYAVVEQGYSKLVIIPELVITHIAQFAYPIVEGIDKKTSKGISLRTNEDVIYADSVAEALQHYISKKRTKANELLSDIAKAEKFLTVGE